MKRFYSFIMFMCLAIGGAWAETGLYILNKEVPVTSSWSYHASYFNSDATGTISYNSNTGALTFNNVKINETGDKIVIYNKYHDELDIFFKGECELTSKNKIIKYDVETTLDGSASTKVRLLSLWDEEAIYSNQGNTDAPAPLHINNFPDLTLWSLDDYCISHKKGAVYFNNSHVTMEGAKGTLHTNFYSGAWYSLVILEDCYFGGDFVWEYTGDSYDFMTYTSETKKEKVKKAVILRSSEYTGVRLDGIPVLTSDNRWNTSQKKLTLNANVSGTSYTYPAGITVEKPGVTIDGGGKTASGRKYGLEQTCKASSSELTTIRNIGLTGNYSGIYTSKNGDTYKYSYLRIEDNVTLSATDYAICGGTVTFAPSSGKTVTLMPLQTSSWTYTWFRSQKAVLANRLTLSECNIINPAGGTAKDSTIYSGTTPWRQQVIIKGWEKYGLSINGTQVHENNKDNLTSLLGSSATGTLKYNPSTKCLTMNNLKASPSSSITKGTLIYFSDASTMTIAVEGENVITANTNSSYTIQGVGYVNIQKGSTSTGKLTLKGNPKWGFIRANSPTIRGGVNIAIDGQTQDGAILNTAANICGNIESSTVTIKSGTTPLSGPWNTYGVYGVLARTDGPAIFINPQSQKLVYFYDNATSPSTTVVTEDINIYPTGTYIVHVNGSKPQKYTEQYGVCFDEFSRRLFLRNISFNGKINISSIAPTIYTIGSCNVINSGCPLTVSGNNLTFTGTSTGQLTLTSTGSGYAAADITGYSDGVIVKNTTLNLNGTKYGMYYKNMSTASYPQMAYLRVIKSKLEAHCTSGNFALCGFSYLTPSECTLYIPQKANYVTAGYDGYLYTPDAIPASDLLISTEAPASLALDTKSANYNVINSTQGKYRTVSIKNLRLKAGGYWSTICLPFDVKLPYSALKDCDVRELSGLTKRNDYTTVLDFTQRVAEIKHDVPYLIKNLGSTDIVNPVFGAVMMNGNEQDVQYGVTYNGNVVFAGTYWHEMNNYNNDLYVLENDPVLVHENNFTMDAFSALFFLNPNASSFYVIYTGTENDLIDGIGEIKDEESAMKNEVYDLSGRRVNKPAQPGLYIVNGKKIAIK